MRVMELKCICRGPPAEEARTPLESEEREARSPQKFHGEARIRQGCATRGGREIKVARPVGRARRNSAGCEHARSR